MSVNPDSPVITDKAPPGIGYAHGAASAWNAAGRRLTSAKAGDVDTREAARRCGQGGVQGFSPGGRWCREAAEGLGDVFQASVSCVNVEFLNSTGLPGPLAAR